MMLPRFYLKNTRKPRGILGEMMLRRMTEALMESLRRAFREMLAMML